MLGIYILLGIILLKPVVIITSLPLQLIYYKWAKNKYLEKKERNNKIINREINDIEVAIWEQPLSLYIILSQTWKGFLRFSILYFGNIPSHFIRNFIYKRILQVELEKNATISFGCVIQDPFKLHIGEGSIIGHNSILDARKGLFIGNNVNMSAQVHIYTEQHDHSDPYFRCTSDDSFRVIIEDRVWIGPRTTILPKVIIGYGAVVAAGAVVTHDIPPYSIVAGIPAKHIKERTHDLQYNLKGWHFPFY